MKYNDADDEREIGKLKKSWQRKMNLLVHKRHDNMKLNVSDMQHDVCVDVFLMLAVMVLVLSVLNFWCGLHFEWPPQHSRQFVIHPRRSIKFIIYNCLEI